MKMRILEKYNILSLPVKASFWFLICNVVQKGISIIIIPLYTRLLTPAEYGEFSLYQTWLGILSIFITLNLYCGVYTKGLIVHSDDKDAYTSAMQGLTSIISFGAILLFALFKRSFAQILNLSDTIILIMLIHIFFNPSLQFWMAKQRAAYKYRFLVFITLLIAVLTPLLSVMFIFLFDDKGFAVIIGNAIIQILFGALFYIFFLFKNRSLYNKKYWIEAVKFNIPLIPHYLSLIILGQSDRIMINMFNGADATGLYSLANQISSAISILTAAITNTLVPWTYQCLKDKRHKAIRKNANAIIIILAISTYLIMIIAPEALKIISTKQYYDAMYVIPPLTVSVFITFAFSLMANIEFYYEKTKKVMIASLICACVNILLNAMFLPFFGYKAAAYTTLLSYFLLMTLHYINSNKICKDLNYRFIYNFRLIFSVSIILSFASLFFALLYNFILVRYFILLLSMIIIIYKRRTLITLIMQIHN